MYESLITLFNHIVPLDQDDISFIKSKFKPIIIKKGDYFLKSGEINTHVGFINKGLVRYFVYKDDNEVTFEFTKEGEFVSDYQSFSKKRPSIQNIQAIEDCELLIIDYDDTQLFFNILKQGNYIGRQIIEHRFDVMVKQLLSIYMHSHEERYTHFIEQYIDLTQRIPQYLIASYVGVKPESLSRIRKRFSEAIS